MRASGNRTNSFRFGFEDRFVFFFELFGGLFGGGVLALGDVVGDLVYGGGQLSEVFSEGAEVGYLGGGGVVEGEGFFGLVGADEFVVHEKGGEGGGAVIIFGGFRFGRGLDGEGEERHG